MTFAVQPERPMAGRSFVRPEPVDGSRADITEAGLVHDLGNLIQVAAAALAIVARNPEMPRPEAGSILARAQASLDKAGALVRRNIGLVRARSLAGAESTDVATCLDDVATLVEALGECGLDIELAIEPDLPHARCDPMGLQNAILNLVFNARDAMPGGGCVAIHAAASARLGVDIQVADTGIGMSSATIARAFEPFFTTKGDGLGGVGLPMVMHFVREAGGEIAVDSAPGEGTCITLRLPAFDRPPPSRR
jgi:signal transduction histidine kinase